MCSSTSFQNPFDRGRKKPWSGSKEQFVLHSRPHAQKTSSRSFVSGTIHRPLAGMLDLQGGFNHLFIKSQILLYASILEDPDRLLSRVPQSPLDVRAYFARRSSKRSRTFSYTGTVSPTLVTTRHTTSFSAAKRREIAIKEIRFEQRVALAVRARFDTQGGLGLHRTNFIQLKSYHLINSAARDFTPIKPNPVRHFAHYADCRTIFARGLNPLTVVRSARADFSHSSLILGIDSLPAQVGHELFGPDSVLSLKATLTIARMPALIASGAGARLRPRRQNPGHSRCFPEACHGRLLRSSCETWSSRHRLRF